MKKELQLHLGAKVKVYIVEEEDGGWTVRRSDV